jgi:hypothetical protein
LDIGARTGGAGADEAQTALNAAVESYLRAMTWSRGTCNESSIEILGHSVGGITYRH